MENSLYMREIKTQRGVVHLVVILTILVLAAVVVGAFYFGRNFSLKHGGRPLTETIFPAGPVEPPEGEISFQKSFNLITIGPGANTAYIKEIKDLGANTVTLFYAAAISRESEFPGKTRMKQLISEAHKQGLQVEIRNSFAAEGDTTANVEETKRRMVDFAVDLAQFAQEQKVYRLAPFSEIDNNLFNYESQVSETAQTILREVKKHYEGQVGVGIAAPWRARDYDFSGYDYMSVSIYPKTQQSLDEYFQGSSDVSLQTVLSGARSIAERSGVETLIIGETGVFNPGEERWTAFETKILTKEEEADYYRRFFEATSNRVQGYSPAYFGYMGLQNDPAADVVREWYTKL